MSQSGLPRKRIPPGGSPPKVPLSGPVPHPQSGAVAASPSPSVSGSPTFPPQPLPRPVLPPVPPSALLLQEPSWACGACGETGTAGQHLELAISLAPAPRAFRSPGQSNPASSNLSLGPGPRAFITAPASGPLQAPGPHRASAGPGGGRAWLTPLPSPPEQRGWEQRDQERRPRAGPRRPRCQARLSVFRCQCPPGKVCPEAAG